MRWPVTSFRITQYYSTKHKAVDIAPRIAGNTTTAIIAPERGRIREVGKGTVEGNYLFLKGTDTKKWHYLGHFAKIIVKKDQIVLEGQKLGIMGKTGLATGIHTHYEIRRYRTGVNYDPVKYHLNSAVVNGKSSIEWYRRAKILDASRNKYRDLYNACVAQYNKVKEIVCGKNS